MSEKNAKKIQQETLEEMKLSVIDGKLFKEGQEKPYYIIRVKSFKRKTQDGKEFNAYKAICSNKRYLDLSFTQECPEPKSDLDFVIVSPKFNVDTNRMYPRVYIKDYDFLLDFNKDLSDILQYVRSCE